MVSLRLQATHSGGGGFFRGRGGTERGGLGKKAPAYPAEGRSAENRLTAARGFSPPPPLAPRANTHPPSPPPPAGPPGPPVPGAAPPSRPAGPPGPGRAGGFFFFRGGG